MLVSCVEKNNPEAILETKKNVQKSERSAINSNIPTEINEIKFANEQLDNTKGLSNSSVNTIFQDSENLIWIGTWDGLNRYDGNNFKIFRPEPNNENSISNHVILKIAEDNTGNIWVLTMHGINRYDKKTNSFRRFYFSGRNQPSLSETDFNIAVDGAKNVFCAAKDWGIGYFLNDDFQLLTIDGLPTVAVKKMEFISNSELLVLFENNELHLMLCETRESGEKSISISSKVKEDVNDFGIFKNQNICILTINGDITLQTLSGKKEEIIEENEVQDIVGYLPEGILLTNKSEYFIINNNGLRVKKLWLENFQNQKVTTVFKGTENVLWTGTDGDGLFKIYPLSMSFNLISNALVPELEGGIVRAFTEFGENSFWVGTKGKGLFRFSSKFYLNPEEPIKYEIFNEDNSSVNNAVYALCKGIDDLIFIGTDGEGINIYDSKKSKLYGWTEILKNDNVGYFKSIYSIYQDKNGFIWLGSNGYGLIRFKIERSGEKLKVVQFKTYNADNEQSSLSSNIIFSILPKSENELWIGTRLGGLNLLNVNTGLFRVFKNKTDDIQSLSDNDILCLYTDFNDKLWIGTSYGLNVLEELKDDGNVVFKSYTVKDGLPNNTIHGIAADSKSNLWISTNYGLSNFIAGKSKFINYTQNEGLQNNEFSDGAFYQDVNSEFVFMGGIKGFNYFLPSEIEESLVIPDILIDKISGQNQITPYYQGIVISPDSKSHSSIVLKHDQNFLDIEMAAITYIGSEKCQYAYQLENFDQEWNFIDNRKNFSFTNVPPGKYSLWIKWTNSDGVWGNPVQALDIRIKPIIWLSKVALLIYSVLLFLFFKFVADYFKERRLLKQNIEFQKREEEIHQNKLNFFTNVAHEFQTPLTLIEGPAQKLSESVGFNEKERKFVRMIQRNSSRLLFLTQQLLEFRKAEYDYLDVKVQEFDLVNLIEQIAELFDELALSKNIDFKLELPAELQGWFDKDKIEKTVFNLLSNAFKYTPKGGKINLDFFISGDDTKTLNIIVSNTGKGIPEDNLDLVFDRFFLSDNPDGSDKNMFRTGIGLSYVKRIVTVLKGSVTVANDKNKSTVFTVLLPCSKVAFSAKELDKETNPVLISYHLKNILEDVSAGNENVPDKISSLEHFENTKKTILIVEDEIEIHLLLKEILGEKYKIRTAYNGAEALAIIEKEIPDIIISDVMMPVMDGLKLCEKIKTDAKTCHIPFVMLTAKDSVLHRIEGIESGANSYIPKPFHPDHLLIRVQKLLEEKELILKYLRKDNFAENLSNLSVEDEDKDFIKKIIDIVRNNIEDENLKSEFLENELGYSSSQLYRKVKQIFGFSPGDLIRTIRLKYAADLLRENVFTVSEICYRSGFNNRSYFYREFNKMYNITPKNFQLKHKS